MEIKTTKQIIFENSTKTFTRNDTKNVLFDSDNTKWIKVLDVKNIIDDVTKTHSQRLYELRQQLKGD